MNKSILCGRWTADPEIRWSQGDKPCCIASGTLAVDRRFKNDNGPSADFIRVKAFGKTAEFIEKYMHKGTKAIVVGRIETGSYDDKDGKKVYTTEVVIEELDFAESKKNDNSAPADTNSAPAQNPTPASCGDGFVVPDMADDELPFH